MLNNAVLHLRALVALTLLLAAGVLAVPPPLAWAGTANQTSPTVTLSPATARPNQSIAVTGQGFTTGGNAIVSSITIGGAAIAGEKINFDNPVTIDSGGSFVANVIIPVNSTALNGGSYSIAVTDSAGEKASASLTMPTPTISVSPASSRVGSAVTVTGANFPLDNSSIGSEDVPEVTLEYEVAANNFRRVATAVPDSVGGFTVSFTVPSNVAGPSKEKNVRASLAGSSGQVTANHTVLGPTFTLTPAKGPAGTTVALQGSNFLPYAPVESLSLGILGVEIADGLYTDASGGFSASFEVPTADGGAQPLILKVGDRHYTQTFTVEGGSTSSETDGYVEAPLAFDVVRTLRPLEDNLLRVFYFDNATKEWSFYDPRPEVAYFNTLPELVEGQPYWIGVREDQTPIIQGSIHTFIAGWNLIVW